MAAEAELKCQNPALSVVGKDGIELEGKLQDSSPFAEVLHEAEQECCTSELCDAGRTVC